MIQVDVELKRIQTFLFQVPQLKAMLGANALVGEVMRVKLAELARPLSLGQQGDFGFEAYPDDPLNDLSRQPIENRKDLKDDPAYAYSQGILARDGGHFSALFGTDEKADEFMKSAEALISNELPGVLFELRKRKFGEKAEDDKQVSNILTIEAILDIPVLQICTATGQGPATANNNKHKDKKYLSKSAQLREQNGDKFYQGKTRDIIGLLNNQLGLNQKNNPDDLNDLVDGGYLALIHADGNSIGNRYKEWKNQFQGKDELLKEAHGEKFFHSMRVVVRKAVVEAIKITFNDSGSTQKRLYQPLMLGGDDLVMVCRADLALDFCRQLCLSIKKYHLVDGQKLTLGLGVAIAKAGYPFYRLNELAEELASSAKRLAHGQIKGEEVSVIDWQVVSQSNFSALAATRGKADFITYRINDSVETLILNQRPYQVLPKDTADLTSLAGLLDAVEPLSKLEGAARSALRGLRGEYEKGRLHGELAFDNLIQDNRNALLKAGIEVAWDEHDGYYSTPLFDLIELTELQHLGNRKSQ
ncbi:Cas10/Cmr2 second palm domain-containing protein [Methylobacter psychrophilus]|uniref:Cas10/Cmr2 second palm domain-containing protein n=1 Tax=Methylobacter psychrophilus TaxID=96941 RepID=UPI0021D4E4DD|nr:hypothetical protein [Methylobacter psychrophilus]